MKLGNKIYLFFILLFISISVLKAEEKITTSPLINVDEIKPSFEESIEENENLTTNKNLKKKIIFP